MRFEADKQTLNSKLSIGTTAVHYILAQRRHMKNEIISSQPEKNMGTQNCCHSLSPLNTPFVPHDNLLVG